MPRVLGITDDYDTCECCGKRGLKRVVVLEFETLGIMRYGVSCAAMAVHGRNSNVNQRRIMEAGRTANRRAALSQEARRNRVALDGNEANYRYIQTNRPISGSYFMTNGAQIVRVDGVDLEDARAYAEMGFSRPDDVSAT